MLKYKIKPRTHRPKEVIRSTVKGIIRRREWKFLLAKEKHSRIWNSSWRKDTSIFWIGESSKNIRWKICHWEQRKYGRNQWNILKEDPATTIQECMLEVWAMDEEAIEWKRDRAIFEISLYMLWGMLEICSPFQWCTENNSKQTFELLWHIGGCKQWTWIA